MEIELLEPITEYVAKFELKDVKNAFANAIRRAMIADVPTLAIDHVKFYDNTSVFFDEMLALRLGLIPIRGDLDSFKFQSDCECGGEGCGLCQVSLSLNAQCPNSEEELIVYSKDIKSQDSETLPAQQDIPIIKLKCDQKIMVEAVVRKGRGREHAKFQPTTVCGYKNRYLVEFGSDCSDCTEHKCVEVCPREVFKVVDGHVSVANETNCSLCKLCIDACEGIYGSGNSRITITELEDNFIFNVESDGSMDVGELVILAADSIKEKVNELSEKLAEL